MRVSFSPAWLIGRRPQDQESKEQSKAFSRRTQSCQEDHLYPQLVDGDNSDAVHLHGILGAKSHVNDKEKSQRGPAMLAYLIAKLHT